MSEHLVISTLIALCAVFLVLGLPRVSAQVRFTVLLIATLGFVLPTPLLMKAGESAGGYFPRRSNLVQPMLEGLLRPDRLTVGVENEQAAPAREGAEFGLLWMLGIAVSLWIWVRRRSDPVLSVRQASVEEMHALERAAARMGVVNARLKIATSGQMPGAEGIWRPVVILGDHHARLLGTEELESVCAHELAHIRRRDNLWAAISRGVATVFWFHPLVWWMERRMRLERELACDELVMASGPREVYATAIGKVCLVASGVQESFAGIDGPNLKQRLERIVMGKVTVTGRGLRSIPAILALLALLIPVGTGFVRAQGTALGPGDALYQTAKDSFDRKDYAQAETVFRRMMAEYPNDARGATGMAEVYMAQQRAEDAIRLMHQGAERNPSSLEYRVAAGNLLVRTERYKEALAEYENALKLASTAEQTASVYFKIGETYRRMGDLDRAMETFRKANDGKASLQVALILEGTGERDRAMAAYKAILAQDPLQTVALNNLAFIMADRGEELDKALEYALRARAGAPKSPDVADTLGWVYLKLRRPGEATATLTDAMLMPSGTSPSSRQHLAAAMDMRGEWTSARQELRTLLDTASTPEQLLRMHELLRDTRN